MLLVALPVIAICTLCAPPRDHLVRALGRKLLATSLEEDPRWQFPRTSVSGGLQVVSDGLVVSGLLAVVNGGLLVVKRGLLVVKRWRVGRQASAQRSRGVLVMRRQSDLEVEPEEAEARARHHRHGTEPQPEETETVQNKNMQHLGQNGYGFQM